ncbi:hypothetical protein LZL87_013510 [Fusarium oxysporum]|nr:hypothetical protein LZL87_013510 [Fusarium oxysporum]
MASNEDHGNVGMESETDSRCGDAATEHSPLLATDISRDVVVPDQTFKRLVVGMCALFLFIVEVSTFLMQPPLQQLLETRLCAEILPDLGPRTIPDMEDRCKSSRVQVELARLRSWEVAGAMFVSFFVQIPYGIIADKYGRRPVLFLALLGTVSQAAWVLLVIGKPEVFSVWSLLYGNIAFLIGGGMQMAGAMVWTLVADTVPVAERTSVFYLLHSMILILAIAVNPIAAFLLRIDAWYAIWLGFGILVAGLFASLLVPETLTLRRLVDKTPSHSTSATDSVASVSKPPQRSWFQYAGSSIKNDLGHIVRFIFASKGVMILSFAYAIIIPVNMNLAFNLLQYMTKRFNWSWSTATYISTVSSITAAAVLLVFLPAGSWVLANKSGLGPLERDLLLTRISLVFIIGGSFLTAFAPTVWLFIGALVATSLGVGYSTLCRALLNAIVEPHAVATLNTTIAMLEGTMMLVSSPVLGWLLSIGLDVGGVWMGLPYLACAGLATVAGVLIASFRLPSSCAQAPPSSSTRDEAPSRFSNVS